ncbi:MAG: SCP2 sterol-binding domain-containing protein [Thiotrichales bacterium]|nr:MAG: SCP2 sterol-binding domain-containing protein [Thiotrichales bacterium]
MATLNSIFDESMKDGELDFLQDRVVRITIEDIGIDYRLSFDGEKLVAGTEYESPDLHLKGTLYNYMLLASRREDADTLFFSRRLHMQGDTELGLYVKNFLDGLDMESQRIPAMLEAVTRKSLPWYERLFG